MNQSTQEPTFWPLNGQLGWRTAEKRATNISAGDDGLELTALPEGPLALNYPDGSLGGLALPRGFAISEDGIVYLLTRRDPWLIKRFEPVETSDLNSPDCDWIDPSLASSKPAFRVIPGIGGAGKDARLFWKPRNIAIAGMNLYVADTGNQRIQVFSLRSLALLHVWTFAGWNPVDVCSSGGWAYILDQRSHRVYRHHPEANGLELVVSAPPLPGAQVNWTRVIVDGDGRIYLYDRGSDTVPAHLDEFDPLTGIWKQVKDAGEVRARFAPPALRLYFDQRTPPVDANGIFCMPSSLSRPCNRELLENGPAAEKPLALCPPQAETQRPAPAGRRFNCPPQADSDSLFASQANLSALYDRDGEPIQLTADQMVEPKLYQPAGVWISQALDSQIFRCQWHRVELEMDALPAGTHLVVSTYSSPDNSDAIERPEVENPLWQVGYRAGGLTQPDPQSAPAGQALAQSWQDSPQDFLVQSRPGQYLWVKVELFSDGFSSPLVRGLRVHFPRQSYLSYLPAIYSDEESRWFLERFLSIFQTEWDEIEKLTGRIAAYFDPAAVPARGGFLEGLASWVALPLEGDWDEDQKRRLLQTVPRYYPQRGTIQGLRAFLQVYLQNISGWPIGDRDLYPAIVEGFRVRDHLLLSGAQQSPSGEGHPLWGPEEVGRLQVGVFSRLGEVQLVSTGDPQRDIFHHYAHRFQLYIPSVWVQSADDERKLRRAIEQEKPAHAAYDLCLVEPRFRIGIQSTIGLDTILGGVPSTILTCAQALQDAPPSQAPRGRLGYDTVLSRHPDVHPPALPTRTGLMLQ